ncbi:hypothetical protein ACTA71_009342 [Dictyostelium dimigraforme]
MKSFESFFFSNVNKTKKSFQIFNNDFPLDKTVSTKVNKLIRIKNFSKLKDMMNNGEKFLLSEENIHSLLLNCHDRNFYETLYEKKLLFNYNLIDESIKLGDVNALELMVQIFAGGWDNYQENDQRFYIIMVGYAFNKSDLAKDNLTNYIFTKIKKSDQLTLISTLIKQTFDFLDLDSYQTMFHSLIFA